jgi:SAM-dependent methyltransferase
MALSRTLTTGGAPMPRLWRLVLELIYRGGVIPWDARSGSPVPGLAGVVEGPPALPPGRAIDLGCGTGRNSVYLARHGWDVTAVEVIPAALAAAARRAKASGVHVRHVLGDVTRLEDAPVGDGYTLVLDAACYHMLAAERRPGFAAGVTRLAAPGALLLMMGWIKAPGASLTTREVRSGFPGWELVVAEPVPTRALLDYIGWSGLLRRSLDKGSLEAWAYQLRRRAS